MSYLIYAILSGIGFGFTDFVFGRSSAKIDNTIFLFTSSLLRLGVVLLFGLFAGLSNSISPQFFISMFIAAAMMYGMQRLLLSNIKTIGVSIPIVLVNIYPIWVAVFSLLQGVAISGLLIVALIGLCIGLYFVFIKQGERISPMQLFLSLMPGFLLAGAQILQSEILRVESVYIVTLYFMIWWSVFGTFEILLQKKAKNLTKLNKNLLSYLIPYSALYLFALVTLGLAFQTGPILIVTILSILSVPITILLDILVLKSKYSLQQFGGIIILTLSVIIAILS